MTKPRSTPLPVTVLPVTLTEEQAANYLGVGVDLLRRLRHENAIPNVRFGERVLYYPPSLDDFLLRKAAESVREATVGLTPLTVSRRKGGRV